MIKPKYIPGSGCGDCIVSFAGLGSATPSISEVSDWLDVATKVEFNGSAPTRLYSSSGGLFYNYKKNYVFVLLEDTRILKFDDVLVRHGFTKIAQQWNPAHAESGASIQACYVWVNPNKPTKILPRSLGPYYKHEDGEAKNYSVLHPSIVGNNDA